MESQVDQRHTCTASTRGHSRSALIGRCAPNGHSAQSRYTTFGNSFPLSPQPPNAANVGKMIEWCTKRSIAAIITLVFGRPAFDLGQTELQVDRLDAPCTAPTRGHGRSALIEGVRLTVIQLSRDPPRAITTFGNSFPRSPQPPDAAHVGDRGFNHRSRDASS